MKNATTEVSFFVLGGMDLSFSRPAILMVEYCPPPPPFYDDLLAYLQLLHTWGSAAVWLYPLNVLG